MDVSPVANPPIARRENAWQSPRRVVERDSEGWEEVMVCEGHVLE